MRANAVSRVLCALLLLGALWPAAQGHHSAAMFDDSQRVTLSGTVREFQWSNPHCYVQLLVAQQKGPAQEWSLEMGAPTYLYNLGWRPSTLKAGDKITAKIAPLRKGGAGGLLLEVTTADGRRYGGKP
jgi:Family of unknown function (DUF6152)